MVWVAVAGSRFSAAAAPAVRDGEEAGRVRRKRSQRVRAHVSLSLPSYFASLNYCLSSFLCSFVSLCFPRHSFLRASIGPQRDSHRRSMYLVTTPASQGDSVMVRMLSWSRMRSSPWLEALTIVSATSLLLPVLYLFSLLIDGNLLSWRLASGSTRNVLRRRERRRLSAS